MNIKEGKFQCRSDIPPAIQQTVLNNRKYEASYFDRINMTKNRLECDRKNITPTNMNVGT